MERGQLREYLIRLWSDACKCDQSESHAGFVDGSKSITDRHGNIIKISPKQKGETAYIASAKLVKDVPVGAVPISSDMFSSLLDMWQDAWDDRRFKNWNNAKVTSI